METMTSQKPRIAPSPAAARPWFVTWAILAIAAFALCSRWMILGADPPAWIQGAFISDEGWWADCARGKVFFNNYFSDDFGTAYLVTPGYTWALEVIYRIAGVGTVQTRALTAMATLATILVLAWALWRAAGWRAALIAALMLTLSPFYWANSRIGFQEPFQGMAIAVAFACWILRRRHAGWAAAAGMALGLAVVIKPNAMTLGGFPLALAAAGSFIVERAQQRSAADRARLWRHTIRQMLLAGLGAALVLAVVFFVHARPNWTAFKTMALAESGANRSTWKDRLVIPGMLLMSTELRAKINIPIFWAPAAWSPALMSVFWLYGLGLLLWLRGGWKPLLRHLNPVEAAALCWALGTLAAIGSEFYQPDRRYVLAIPPVATACGLFLGRFRHHAGVIRPAETGRRLGWLYAFALWGVLTLPLLVLFKPLLTRLVMNLSVRLPLGREAGLDFSTAGTLVMLGWVAGLGLLAFRSRPAERLGRALFQRRVVLALPAVLLTAEAIIIGASLAGAQSTMIKQQARLRRMIPAQETVMGHMASTVLLPLPVRTVRRVSRFEFTPPPNPDVWDRLKPRYILEMTHRNYQPATPLYDDLVRQGDYRQIDRFAIGPFRNGVARFSFELFERPAGQ